MSYIRVKRRFWRLELLYIFLRGWQTRVAAAGPANLVDGLRLCRGLPPVAYGDSSPQRGKLRCRKPAGGGLSTFQGADFQHSEALLAFQGAFKTRKPEYKHCNFNGHTPDFAIEEPLETQIDLRKTENPPLKSELPHLMPVITRSWAWGW